MNRDRGGAEQRLLPAKNRHNILSMVLFLAVRWFLLFVATLSGAVAVSAFSFLGVLAIAAMMLALLVFRVLITVLVERSVMGFRRLKPQYCSIYDPYFWRHERLWKLLAMPALQRNPVQARDLENVGRQGRQAALRCRRQHAGENTRDYR